jgi:hypothetical protein
MELAEVVMLNDNIRTLVIVNNVNMLHEHVCVIDVVAQDILNAMLAAQLEGNPSTNEDTVITLQTCAKQRTEKLKLIVLLKTVKNMHSVFARNWHVLGYLSNAEEFNYQW